MHRDRIKILNDVENKSGKYVLYWMQAAQRTEFNHALEYAVRFSNSHKQPIVVTFCLVDQYPMANVAQYRFMLEGLAEVKKALEYQNILFQIVHGTPKRVIPKVAEDASLVVVDRDYQRMQRQWRSEVATSLDCSLHQVETNVIVPIETASPKEEYTAGTLRPKIHRILEDYLVPLRNQRIKYPSEGISFDGIDLNDIETVLQKIKARKGGTQQIPLKGGTSQAKKHLKKFISQDLNVFADLRNDPAKDRLSNMSPYLHFGQISPLQIALEIQRTVSPGTESFLEELIVRRELSMNFVFYNQNYDNFESLPNWAKETLELHSFDNREYSYSYAELEQGRTHDPYWNAAQREMTTRGKMHGYMRMYWGKKILEWSDSPHEAYYTCVRLNDTYELDGRDPNGYAGVAWCFGKHDRAWSERQIFGKVRYMNDNGLRRKFDIERYVERVSNSG
ncbi:deoxyribodipyrimidine photo-lyase [Candidatus Thorarchaeota archaeon]|nr:MAG: deoxyribodipyrimidine photo-lyase [Candidatus Thorarchaeota archaeon]